MRKAISLVFCLTLVASVAVAQQIKTPMPSPKASLTQTIGTTDVTINWSRPGVKGRTIWGGLVPYDKVWRTGANAATTISFSDDVTINGQALKKGTYSLHTIPGRDQWAVIFNSVADQWGSYSYDPAKDALRVNVQPVKAEYMEWLNFEIPAMTTDEGTVRIRWENVAVPFTVNTDSTNRTLAAYRRALSAPDWRMPYMAANFAFENKVGSADEINKWLDQSIKADENLANLWLKARVQERAGNKAAAIATAEKAISKATEGQKDFAAEVRRMSDEWRK